jgi:hypothetical protein
VQVGGRGPPGADLLGNVHARLLSECAHNVGARRSLLVALGASDRQLQPTPAAPSRASMSVSDFVSTHGYPSNVRTWLSLLVRSTGWSSKCRSGVAGPGDVGETAPPLATGGTTSLAGPSGVGTGAVGAGAGAGAGVGTAAVASGLAAASEGLDMRATAGGTLGTAPVDALFRPLPCTVSAEFMCRGQDQGCRGASRPLTHLRRSSAAR